MAKATAEITMPDAPTITADTVVERSTLPSGVEMRDAAATFADDRRRPPAGWQGSYESCGGCGDFLPTGPSGHECKEQRS
jgi:hypothetical protein